MNARTPRPSAREAWNGLRAGIAELRTPAQPSSPAPAAPTKRPWHELPSATFTGEDGSLSLYRDAVDHQAGLKKTKVPLHSIRAVTLEDGADLEARITATRLVLVGVFALALKKKRGGEKYLTVEADETVLVVRVPRKKIAAAHKFSAELRTAVLGAQ